jgi:4-amino-4-deoxy-L-arabinose transferase-like glycosyltransferase
MRSRGTALVGLLPNSLSRRAAALNITVNQALFAVAAVSVVLRVAAALYMGDVVQVLPGIADQDSYQMLAQQVLGGHGFTVARDWWPLTRAGQPTAHWSYIYTLYLVATYAVAGIHPLVARLVQALVAGVLLPLLVFRVARHVTHERIALVAAAWSAVYGYFIYYGAALMTEPFFICAVLWTLDVAMQLRHDATSWRRWAWLGLALGLAVLLRQSYLTFAPVLVGWVWIAAGRGRLLARLRANLPGVLMAVGLAALLVLPWTVRNFFAFRQVVLLNTSSGFAFYWANHPMYGTEFISVLPDDQSYMELVPPQLLMLNEAELDSALLRLGLQEAVSDPRRYAMLSLSRIGVLYEFWPSPESSSLSNAVRVLSFGLALPLALVGLVALRRGWRELTLLYLFVVVFSGVHILSWALVRYRLPIDAVFLIFAAAGLTTIVEWFGSRLRGRDEAI